MGRGASASASASTFTSWWVGKDELMGSQRNGLDWTGLEVQGGLRGGERGAATEPGVITKRKIDGQSFHLKCWKGSDVTKSHFRLGLTRSDFVAVLYSPLDAHFHPMGAASSPECFSGHSCDHRRLFTDDTERRYRHSLLFEDSSTLEAVEMFHDFGILVSRGATIGYFLSDIDRAISILPHASRAGYTCFLMPKCSAPKYRIRETGYFLMSFLLLPQMMNKNVLYIRISHFLIPRTPAPKTAQIQTRDINF
ncbi:hypothetical protein VTL71DRAFT_10572 [Oculimacula yallundae]|uniref:Uncharacterized protein n=1 Tax=Oculimacula yallundae TaxID=86028 RepID=A0ABR4CTD5_9HELO